MIGVYFLRFDAMYIVFSKKEEKGYLITDARDTAKTIGIARSTLYNWTKKSYYMETPKYIIIKDPKIIKSKRGGRVPPFAQKA